MSLENMTNTLFQQMNNPDCSYLVGMQLGSMFAFRILIFMGVFYFALKLIDRLAFNPLVEWIKNKIYKHNNRQK